MTSFLQYLPVVGYLFIKPNEARTLETFLKAFVNVCEYISAGVIDHDYDERSIVQIILPLSGDNRRGTQQLNAWDKYLTFYNIYLDLQPGNTATLRFTAGDGATFLFENLSKIHHIYRDLELQRPFTSVRGDGIENIFQSYEINVDAQEHTFSIPLSYAVTARDISSALARIENILLKLTEDFTDLANTYRRIHILPENVHARVQEISQRGVTHTYVAPLTREEIQQNLERAASKADMETHSRLTERNIALSDNFKSICINRNKDEVCSYKPLTNDDWCDVEEKFYHDIQDQTGLTRCFDINELLQHCESQLSKIKSLNPYPQPPDDWNNRRIFDFSQLREIYDHADNVNILHDYPIFKKFVESVMKKTLRIPEGMIWDEHVMNNVIEVLELPRYKGGKRRRRSYIRAT